MNNSLRNISQVNYNEQTHTKSYVFRTHARTHARAHTHIRTNCKAGIKFFLKLCDRPLRLHSRHILEILRPYSIFCTNLRKFKKNSAHHQKWCAAMAKGAWQQPVRQGLAVMRNHATLNVCGFGDAMPPVGDDPVGDELRSAAEFVSCCCHVAGEFAWSAAGHEFSYPDRFATLLVNDGSFPARVSVVRRHFDTILKYERLALTDPEIARHLGHIHFLQSRTVRVSFMLWSASVSTAWADQDSRADSCNRCRFGGLGDTVSNEVCNRYIREHEKQGSRIAAGLQPSSMLVMRQYHHAVITSSALDQRRMNIVTPSWQGLSRAAIQELFFVFCLFRVSACVFALRRAV